MLGAAAARRPPRLARRPEATSGTVAIECRAPASTLARRSRRLPTSDSRTREARMGQTVGMGDPAASSPSSDDLFVATPVVAAKLAGVTVPQLERWRRSGLVVPTVVRRLSPVMRCGCTTSPELSSCAWLRRSVIVIRGCPCSRFRSSSAGFEPHTAGPCRSCVTPFMAASCTSSTRTARGKVAVPRVNWWFTRSSAWRRFAPSCATRPVVSDESRGES